MRAGTIALFCLVACGGTKVAVEPAVPGAPFSGTDGATGSVVVSPQVTTTYTLTAIAVDGPKSEKTVTVTVSP
jgi:hypothetical protein